MKRTLQIAAGIILATAVLFVGRLLLLNAAVKTAATSIRTSAERAAQSLQRAADRQRAEVDARRVREKEERRRALEANCYVITADGRKLTCPDRQ